MIRNFSDGYFKEHSLINNLLVHFVALTSVEKDFLVISGMNFRISAVVTGL